ncbi:MAG TPA: PDZ domain-containing protein [Longimicrobium sp.]|uniref:PDZ domain-containing protein n=1 Tax=Longimicrobium sp. TaxID=2029185 RepID=UPI002ED9C279
MKFRTLFLPLVAAVLALPAAARAQDTPGPERRPGMLGFAFDVTRREETGQPARQTVRVTEVREGSPAARAGMRQGDLLVSVNGAALEGMEVRSLLQVNEGDTVRLRVRRVDGEHDLRIVAGPRPAQVAVRTPGERQRVVVRQGLRGEGGERRIVVDSLVRRLPGSVHVEVTTGDSGRAGHRIVVMDSGDSTPRVRMHPSTGEHRVIVINGDTMQQGDVVRTVTVDTLAFPVQWLAERIDSLSRVVRVDTFIAARLDSLTRVLHDSIPVLLERGRGPAAAALRNLPALRGNALVRVGDASAQSFFMDVGRAAAAGAQLAEMNEGLGRYFGGRTEGVLVLEVTQRSPASRAGLEAGDVIVGVDGAVVQTPEDVRSALSRDEDGTLLLNVVRQGRRREVTLQWDRQQDFVRVFGPETVELDVRPPPAPRP